jgi:hypothetical protein
MVQVDDIAGSLNTLLDTVQQLQHQITHTIYFPQTFGKSKLLVTFNKQSQGHFPIRHIMHKQRSRRHYHVKRTLPNQPQPSNHLPLCKFTATNQHFTINPQLLCKSSAQWYEFQTQAHAAACVQKNRIFLCKCQQVINTSLEGSCLGSLYLQSERGGG